MELFIKVNGLLMKIKKMVVEYKFGQMAQDMMVSGEMEWQMAMVVWSMQKEMFMKVNGQKIKQMVLVYILISTAVGMKVNGFKINNMVMVLSNGQMVPNMKDNTNKE